MRALFDQFVQSQQAALRVALCALLVLAGINSWQRLMPLLGTAEVEELSAENTQEIISTPRLRERARPHGAASPTAAAEHERQASAPRPAPLVEQRRKQVNSPMRC